MYYFLSLLQFIIIILYNSLLLLSRKIYAYHLGFIKIDKEMPGRIYLNFCTKKNKNKINMKK